MARGVRGAALAALVSAASAAGAQAPDPAAVRARIAQLEALVPTIPDPSLAYLIASDYAELGDRAKTLEWLGRAADARAGFETRNPAFARFSGDPDFERLRARMAAETASVLRSRRAFVIDRPGLVPEGLAWDPAGRLFVSDMAGRRILAVDRAGRVRDFAQGLRLRPVGLKVDRARGRLWVATTNAFWDTPKKEAELLGLDLRTGRVVARHGHADATSFNDLDVAPDGDLYVTDSDGGAVYRLPADSPAMQRVTPKGAMAYPNGIAWLNGAVYVAQGIALRRIDPATGEVARVRGLPGFPGLGIDGLYAHEGSLIAVQGFGFKGRVSRLQLSPEGDAVAAARLLEAANPAFDVPTTAAPAGDRLYLLANSQLDRLRPDGSVAGPLQPIVILELPLG